MRRRIAVFVLIGAMVSASCSPASQTTAPAASTTPAADATVEEGKQLSALAPANLAKPRPKPPFEVTGNWFIDVSQNPEAWRFGPPYPKLTPAAQLHWDAAKKYTAEGKVYRDDIGQCWPAGLPLIMTRYWPMAMVQVPTAIYMISGETNTWYVSASKTTSSFALATCSTFQQAYRISRPTSATRQWFKSSLAPTRTSRKV